MCGCGCEEERVTAAGGAVGGSLTWLWGLRAGAHGGCEVGGQLGSEDCGGGRGDDVAGLDCCEECFAEACCIICC